LPPTGEIAMVDTLLFDLDNTLLVNDMHDFIPRYFQALGEKLATIGPPGVLLDLIRESVQATVEDTDPSRTNWEVFADRFFPRAPYPRQELQALFDDFYANDFQHLQGCTLPHPRARSVVSAAFSRGFQVVIATNPVFPLTAIEQRLEWADVADFPYALITGLENMHFTKPHPQYYREILDRVGRAPEQCLMCGDDAVRDMAAAEVGIHTFYIRGDGAESPPATAKLCGDLSDVLAMIEDGSLRGWGRSFC